jgi:hypothetical protein
MLLRALVVVLTLAGCHHDPPPAPPAATSEPRTPVGYLLAATDQLHLEAEQVTHLKELDANLAQQLAALDPQIATAMKAQADASDASSTTPSGGGMRGMGGMRGGGMGGMGGGGMGRRGNGNAPGSGNPHPNAGKGDTLGRLLSQRASDVRATLAIVFSALHPEQLATAKQLLVEHDVDLDDPDADSDRETKNGAGANDRAQGDEHGQAKDGSGGDVGSGDGHQ